MATFTGIAAGIGAAAALASAGNAVVQGAESASKQRKGLRQQKDAQSTAEAAAATTARKADEANARANAKQPDVAGMLANETLTGPFSMLTGAQGVNPNRLQLGRKSLLGA